MKVGSAALRTRPDGVIEYFPPPPVGLLEIAFRAEIALARGPQLKVVGHDMVALACPEVTSELTPMSSRSFNRVPVKFDTERTKEFIANIIEVEFGNHRSKAKAVASHTAGEATPRTVETWARKHSAPSLAAFLNMLVGPNPIPSLRAEMRRLLEDDQIGPSRAIRELECIVARMKSER